MRYCGHNDEPFISTKAGNFLISEITLSCLEMTMQLYLLTVQCQRAMAAQLV